jgi:hypothetical protein
VIDRAIVVFTELFPANDVVFAFDEVRFARFVVGRQRAGRHGERRR